MDIALQHISDPMLKMMRRNITKAETYELLERMRREVPGIHLRTTLMVGHPGETEQDFEELIRFVKDIRFERMGAFAYSHEEGTYAYQHYKDEIPQEEARPAGLLDACARRHLRRRERLESRADLSGDRRPGGGGFLRGTYAIRLARGRSGNIDLQGYSLESG